MPSDVAPITALNLAGAPEFVTTDPQILLNLAKANFEESTGRTLSESQQEMHLLETIAYMLTLVTGQTQKGLESDYIAYAEGRFLDLRGADRNTPRLQAAPAQTRLRFTAEDSASQVLIPAGTRVADGTGTVQFATRDAQIIPVGASDAETTVYATQDGNVGNGFAVGTISVLLDPVPGIQSVINLTETGGGAEVEGDRRYRERLPLAFERIGDGLSQERYRDDVLSWNARCIDVHIDRPQPGYVDIYPLMDNGAPNAQELASLLSVFNESNIHQGDFIQTKAPTPHEFTAELHLVLSAPDAADPAEQAVQDVLDRWEQSLGGYIAPSELTDAARDVAGVVDADVPNLAFATVSGAHWRKCTGLLVVVSSV